MIINDKLLFIIHGFSHFVILKKCYLKWHYILRLSHVQVDPFNQNEIMFGLRSKSQTSLKLMLSSTLNMNKLLVEVMKDKIEYTM